MIKKHPKIGLLHVPKCAGTSIRSAIEIIYPDTEICPSRHDQNLDASYSLYSGHFSYTRLSRLDLDHTFMVLREPFERLVSAYLFLRAHSASFALEHQFDLCQIAKRYSLDEFCQHDKIVSHPFFNNPYVSMLTFETLPARWEKSAPEFTPKTRATQLHLEKSLKIIESENIEVYNLQKIELFVQRLKVLLAHNVKLEKTNVTIDKNTVDLRFEPINGIDLNSKEMLALKRNPIIGTLIGYDCDLYSSTFKDFDPAP